MKLSGRFQTPGTRQQVYAFLTDPGRVVGALPNIQSSTVSPDGFVVDAKVGVGPMRGTMSVRLDIVDREPDSRAIYKGQGKGLGSSVDLIADFSLEDGQNGSGTTVAWSGDARIGGRLASVAGGMLEPLAKKNIQQFVTAVQQGLQAEA